MSKNKYMVWNNTDNISTHHDFFTTIKEAKEFIKNFRERFKQQGYYRDNRWNMIAPENIELEIIKLDK